MREILEAFELYSRNQRSVRKGLLKRSRHTGNIRGEGGWTPILSTHSR